MMKIYTGFFYLAATAWFIVGNNFIMIMAKSFNVVECKGNQWEVQLNDTEFISSKFQNWIYAWQNNCAPQKYFMIPAENHGIGSAINYATKNLITAIEMNKIYRPDEKSGTRGISGIFLWAEQSDAGYCSLGIRSVDCFLQPLSNCIYNESAVEHKKLSIAKDIADFSNDPIDTCTMAKKARKPLQWVIAEFQSYFMRYKDDVKDFIEQRARSVFSQNQNPALTTIGVTIRGGDPDGGRRIVAVEHYVHHIDKMASTLAAQNRPVGIVYICSNTQEDNVISSDHMNKKFPRSFKFVVLPHVTFGSGIEAETALRDPSVKNKPSYFSLSAEFFADLEILSRVDYFIGSIGNNYPLITSLRIARGHQLHNNMSCFLEYFSDSEGVHPLHCENSAFARKVWHDVWGGLNALKEENNWYNPDKLLF